MSPSAYDNLHDKYFNIITNKSGTKYERLTAFVFKKLYELDTVIHDIKLIGETEVKHQIDVKIETSDGEKRILVECKDFDISGDKVGLGIARNFWGVVDDINPDEAIIVTCNGFTRGAKKYAKGKGIKLALLREFLEDDWNNRIRSVGLEMNIYYPSEPEVRILIDNEETKKEFEKQYKQANIQGGIVNKNNNVYLNIDKKRIKLIDFIQEKRNENLKMETGVIEKTFTFENATIEIEDNTGISIQGIEIKFEMSLSEEYFEITSDKIAELIMEDLSGDDMIIFDQDLIGLNIDKNSGEVINI